MAKGDDLPSFGNTSLTRQGEFLKNEVENLPGNVQDLNKEIEVLKGLMKSQRSRIFELGQEIEELQSLMNSERQDSYIDQIELLRKKSIIHNAQIEQHRVNLIKFDILSNQRYSREMEFWTQTNLFLVNHEKAIDFNLKFNYIVLGSITSMLCFCRWKIRREIRNIVQDFGANVVLGRPVSVRPTRIGRTREFDVVLGRPVSVRPTNR
tara:strand:- start:213 stop:836 length:624 start_codon:yes stop_codon:yes gene_type:complete